MKIRPAVQSDADAISRLVSQLTEKYIACELEDEAKKHLLGSMTPERIQQYLQQGFRYHVAEHEGAIVGVVAIRDNQHLYHLYVAESAQRRGLSRRLWTLAMRESLALGNPGRFTVNSSRYAVGVYERFGFKKTGGAVERHGVVFVPMVLDVDWAQ